MGTGCKRAARRAMIISVRVLFSWFAALAVVAAGLAQTADLSITKSAVPSTGHVGSPLTYTLTANNNGPSDDTAVVVTDSIPFGTTFKKATASQGTCQGASTVKCTLGTLANAASATVTIVVIPGATGTITNTGKISGALTDPNSTNNSSSVSITVMPACTYSISPQEQTFASSGGTGTISITSSDSSCTWTATTANSWITITAGSAGAGNGSATFSVAGNNGATRTGSILAAGFKFTVVEAGKSAPIQFQAPVSYSLNGSATATVASDFNQDGRVDAATAITTGSSAQIEVFLSTGNGTFGQPKTFNLSSSCSQLIATDVNADGYPDLIALVSGAFAVLLNNGNGTFAAPAYYGSGGYNLAIGDFYHDGRVHIAAANGNGGVVIYQNLGNGQFVQATAVYVYAAWVSVSDLNGDGYPDLAVASSSNGYYTVLNNGDGTFTASALIPFAANFVTAADLNGDGLPDLVFSVYNQKFLSIALNQGSGTFAPPVPSSLGSATIDGATVVADIDGDGAPDLLLPDGQNIAILRNLGSGYFAPPVFASGSSLGYNPAPFSLADMNNDGRLDVVAPDTASAGNSFLIFISQTTQACKYVVKPNSIKVANGGAAGTLTVTAASSCSWTATSNEPWITITSGASGKGNGTVGYSVAANTDVAREGVITAAEQTVPVSQVGGLPTLQFGVPSLITAGGSSATAVAVGDFNRDGKQDMAVAVSGDQVLILLGNGDGTFAAPVVYSISLTTQLIAADVNADGYPDLIALAGGQFAVLLNNGNGTFAAPVYYGSAQYNIAVGDFYRDGRVHVATSTGNNILIYQNLGNGQFVQTANVSVPAAWVAVADLNGDGYADLAAAADSNGSYIVLNNGNGTFANPVNTSLGAYFFVTAADVNGDGKPDLILSYGNNSVLSVLLNQGDATFGTPVTYTVPPTGLYGAALVGDLDGDGRPDLLVPNGVGITLMRNLGAGVFEQEDALLTGGSLYPAILATIDLKSDGHLSVVTPNPVAGSDGVLLFTNTTPQVCSYAVTPSSVQLTTATATGKLTVTAASTCSWKAASNEPFITVTGSGTGRGNGTINYAVTKNTDTARLGTIAIRDAAATITRTSAFPPIIDLPSQLDDLGSAVTAFASADFNRDGLTDYVVSTADGTISVFLATTAGHFAAPAHYTFGSGVAPIAADVNSDGYPDLVILSGGIGVAVNKGDGTFSAPTYYPLPNPGATGMTVGDFNQNGHIDLAAISVQAFGKLPLLSVFTNDGTGHFTAQSPAALTTGASFITAADINNDGYIDLVTANGNTEGTRTVSVLLNQKNGKFTLQSPLTIAAFSLIAADLNGDGYPDLVLNSAPDLQVYFGIGDGTFGPPASYAFPTAAYGLPVITDFDGNGKPDVVVPLNNALAFFRNTGRGVLELQDFTATATGLTTIAAGDLNDDGKIDILANAGPTQPTPTTYWLFANETKQVCGFSVTPNNILLPTSGVATEQLVVKASSKCSWQALSHSPWISIQSGGTGTGNGTVMLSVAANAATTGRVATMTVAGIGITITQPGR